MIRSGLVACLLCIVISVVSAQQDTADNSLIQEQATHKVFKGVLYRVWVKLRALNPKPQAERAGRGHNMVVTAGIRGAETTESALQPYWKDDRTDDKAFREQLESLDDAQKMLDDGKITEAGAALTRFIKRYPEGDLLPNALFALGLAQGAAGDTDNGIKALRDFIKSYPQHPLREDAELVIVEFNRSR